MAEDKPRELKADEIVTQIEGLLVYWKPESTDEEKLKANVFKGEDGTVRVFPTTIDPLTGQRLESGSNPAPTEFGRAYIKIFQDESKKLSATRGMSSDAKLGVMRLMDTKWRAVYARFVKKKMFLMIEDGYYELVRQGMNLPSSHDLNKAFQIVLKDDMPKTIGMSTRPMENTHA